MTRGILLRFHQRGHALYDCAFGDADNRRWFSETQGFLAFHFEKAYTAS